MSSFPPFRFLGETFGVSFSWFSSKKESWNLAAFLGEPVFRSPLGGVYKYSVVFVVVRYLFFDDSLPLL